MELTSENVHSVLMDCLFNSDEVRDGTPEHVIGTGVMKKLGFHPGRLDSHKQEIAEMADQLPDEFKEGAGGGGSFMNACMTSEGRQWAEHSNIDELICLGTAIGKIAFPFPRDIWSSLPGGMPYIVVKTTI